MGCWNDKPCLFKEPEGFNITLYLLKAWTIQSVLTTIHLHPVSSLGTRSPKTASHSQVRTNGTDREVFQVQQLGEVTEDGDLRGGDLDCCQFISKIMGFGAVDGYCCPPFHGGKVAVFLY